ncbi:hypothetical protein Q0590_34070 [Rhodocytophaga aerolata]|uniref:Uncharacterized protein n=1 Tax=Rhodocytophaga aerolata TaxID=455078 RepID=A0ABT8RGX2_9BACT|nr:hypothetical protein [Rhodocytophaga aerolata]MDO1451352.1 hypothetical protein [Rhodocytophaga aerolata]
MILNQVLHGYKDGHTLLASSIELEADIKRQMLPMSDMSGGGIIKGFEEYITGYPLKQMNVYALAKTWYAPEMKRPGCVWTHTLLIDFNDLPDIEDIFLLLSLFKRPSLTELRLGDYSKSLDENLDYPYNVKKEPLDTSVSNNLIKRILHSLYGENEKPILIRSSSSLHLEQWLLSIWSQQWPRLRRNFRFCTGSIAPRSFAGTLLDLQVVPYKSAVGSLSNISIVIDETEKMEASQTEEWIELAYWDLYSSYPQLKFFFNFFGSDLPLQRTSFKSLANSYVFFNNNKPKLEECIHFLAGTFPSLQVASNLKLAILNDQNNSFSNFLPRYQENAIVYHLTITKYYESFEYKKLNYLARFRNSFKNLNESSMKLLKEIIKHGPNPYGEEAITELANFLGENEYLQSLWADKQLSSVFISLNPKLTYNKNFWLANENHHIELINQLQKSDIRSKVDWPLIVKLLIETDSNIDPAIFGDQGLKIESIILDWIDKEKSATPRINWLNYVKRNPAAILDWLNQQENPKKHVIEIIVNLLNPNSNIVIKNGLEPWLNFLSRLPRSRLDDVSIDVHSFCLALAFNIDSEKTQNIFELTFEVIYMALSADKLDYRLWKELEKHTKPLSFWKDWDKCKKIINALVDKYIRNVWSIKPMIKHVYNEELKVRISQQYKKRL